MAKNFDLSVESLVEVRKRTGFGDTLWAEVEEKGTGDERQLYFPAGDNYLPKCPKIGLCILTNV